MALKFWGKINSNTAKNLWNVFIVKPCLYQAIRELSDQAPSIIQKNKLAEYRKFPMSETCKNVTKLKISRLSNPFPEPVKVMPSDVITDREKARQTLLEARANYPLLNQSRSYATCGGKKKKCPIIKLKNCKRPKNLDCVTKPYPHKKCKKVKAPYPSYSEACYKRVEQKPSECKLCPRKTSERRKITSKKN